MFAYEGLKELLFSGIPVWQSHSITILFTSILASALVYFVANNATEIKSELDKNDEKIALYNATMTATMHCVGNALNLFHLIQIESEDGGTVSEGTLKLIERELSTTKDFMKSLSMIESPTAEIITDFLQNNLKKYN